MVYFLLSFLNLPQPNSLNTKTLTYFYWLLTACLVLFALPSLQLILISLASFESIVVSYNSLWAIFYFTYFIYVFFAISASVYLLSNLPTYLFSNQSTFFSVNGLDLLRLFLSFLLLLLLMHSSWSGPSLVAWFGHIEFSHFQFKFLYILYFFFTTYLVVFLSTHHLSSLNTFDYLITILNFFLWVTLMPFSNNLFTFIFFLELISAAITLLLVSSSFSSYHFYNNLSFNKHSYFSTSTPTAFLQTLMFFFWITLVSSLILFLSVITFYLRYFSFDFNILTSIFTFLLFTTSTYSLMTLSFSWFLFLVAVSVKCGLLPFYLWKPSFFKGMTISALFFYVYVYYFTVFFLFIYVLCGYFHELFAFYVAFALALVVIATLGLTSLMFESLYLKSFLALSSILNSTLVLYALCGFQTLDALFLV